MGRRDQELWVKYPFLSTNKVISSDRVHVMDQQVRMDVVAGNTEIATFVSNDHELSGSLPLSRTVELLVDPAVKPEGGCAYLPRHGKVGKAFFEG